LSNKVGAASGAMSSAMVGCFARRSSHGEKLSCPWPPSSAEQQVGQAIGASSPQRFSHNPESFQMVSQAVLARKL
jgi:hypothetical protein